MANVQVVKDELLRDVLRLRKIYLDSQAELDSFVAYVNSFAQVDDVSMDDWLKLAFLIRNNKQAYDTFRVSLDAFASYCLGH